MRELRVLVWNENYHERCNQVVAKLYPEGIHGAIASYLKTLGSGLKIRTATLDDPDQGLSEEVLKETDVLIYWGHVRHNDVKDETVERVCKQIQCGMGFIGLHSTHLSKVFTRLMGTTCHLRWRESGESERLFVLEPNHPIMEGVPAFFELDQEEMYGERFDIPTPDELLMLGWFKSGEVFRSACTYRRGNGRIFYFQPGHETYPTFYNEHVLKIIGNAVRWAAPLYRVEEVPHLNPDPLEPLN
jgi:trehalose utilization protein